VSLTALVLTGLVVFATHALEAVTGFGCTVLALPFVTALLGVKVGVPILASVAWLLALYIAITKRTYINFREFARILCFVGLGMPVGIYAFRSLDSMLLKKALAVFIVLSSSWQLWRRLKPPAVGGGDAGITDTTCPAAPRAPLPVNGRARWTYYLLLVLGGVVHGAFASGGPLVVLYASKALPDKGAFRATLCLLWTTLNTVLLINYAFSGTFTAPVLTGVGAMIPFLVAGIVAGEYLHEKADAKLFGKLVFGVLLVTGLFMLVL